MFGVKSICLEYKEVIVHDIFNEDELQKEVLKRMSLRNGLFKT